MKVITLDEPLEIRCSCGRLLVTLGCGVCNPELTATVLVQGRTTMEDDPQVEVPWISSPRDRPAKWPNDGPDMACDICSSQEGWPHPGDFHIRKAGREGAVSDERDGAGSETGGTAEGPRQG